MRFLSYQQNIITRTKLYYLSELSYKKSSKTDKTIKLLAIDTFGDAHFLCAGPECKETINNFNKQMQSKPRSLSAQKWLHFAKFHNVVHDKPN